MPLAQTLSHGLSFAKSKPKGESSRSKPPVAPSQVKSSGLHRSIQKSTFLNGRPPPRSRSSLTPEQILDLTYMLAQPVDTPLLTTSIASLKYPLTRAERSSPVHCLCNVHTWFELQWIDELTSIIGQEIGPGLQHLRDAPRQLRSIETDEMLGMLENYAHIFPAQDPDHSRMANPYECTVPNCSVCNITSCRACRLSQFFQNEAAVRALNVCVKGRKKRNRPWPEACAWLDPLPGSGWEMKWRKEGLPILTDRIIIRKWRHSGGQQRLTTAMASVQAEILAHKEAVERQFDKATKVTEETAYDEILDRRWTMCEEAMRSDETIKLLEELGMGDDERSEQGRRSRADSYTAAYHGLMGRQSKDPCQSSGICSVDKQQVARTKRSPSIISWEADEVLMSRDGTPVSEQELAKQVSRTMQPPPPIPAKSIRRLSRAPSMASVDPTDSWDATRRVSPTLIRHATHKALVERDAESWGASYANLLGPMPQTQSKLSLYYDEQAGTGNSAAMENRQVADAVVQLGRARAQTNFSNKSWAAFNNSPLGEGHRNGNLDAANEQIGETRAPSWSTLHAIQSASVNRLHY